MNLRNVGDYNIGLDLGSASVGWAVTDADGNICHFSKKPTWGSRLFTEAQKAAEARSHRSQRRRYDRRRQRLDLLQGLFAEEMVKVDPDFFIRMNQSRLLREDRDKGCRDYAWPFFNESDFTERDYYNRFPTIYHLRRWLATTPEKADIRLIYLAFHNIVKHRGNFLQQDNSNLTSKNASVGDSVEGFCRTLVEWCQEQGYACEATDKAREISQILASPKASKSDIAKRIAPLLSVSASDALDKSLSSKLVKAISAAIVGLAAEMSDIFFAGGEKPEGARTKIYFSKEEEVEAFDAVCPDDGRNLFEAMQAVYSAFVLQGVLSHAPGQSLSANKIVEYDVYGENLARLKALVKEYAPKEYDSFFRGPLFPGTRMYDTGKAQGYTLYNVARKTSYDDFRKEVIALFSGTGALDDQRYKDMMEEFAEGQFLRRLKTSDNGSIPFQLHLEEMNDIISNQARFFPFLEEHKAKFNSLVSFRIPYYVGPLTTKNARLDGSGNKRFAWAERLPGKEGEKVYPWNWEEIIDKDKSAESFIRRMTGSCSYLLGEPVIPRSSLLYEEFCVLNELNGARFSQDGDKECRFDFADRIGILDDLFKSGRSVGYKRVASWMERNRGHSNVHVSGGQGESGFESKLASYGFFCNEVFKVSEIPESFYPMIEEVILWSTLFEDRDILESKLRAKYGDVLDEAQIRAIKRKRFSGWGRLSEKFLTGVKVETNNGSRSIMEVLLEGNPNNGGRSKPMVLMEVLRDSKLGFQQEIDRINASRMAEQGAIGVEDLPGSPGLRRAVNQALAIVDEIQSIAGHAPSNIFIEVTRSVDERKLGKRTKRRYDEIKEALAVLKDECPTLYRTGVAEELAEKQHGDLDERLTLYFLQGGKCLYSGEPLDINKLSSYQVDHIIPRSFVKDDSFDNKALVKAGENQRKSDQMLVPFNVRRRMRPYWDALFRAKLMSEKKYRNLLRSELSEQQMRGFINRQIVETSQIVKLTAMLLRTRMPEANVVPVKAGLSSELRKSVGLVKCREINDFHHAHDALLACNIGRFIQKRFPDMLDNPLVYAQALKAYVRAESEEVRRGSAPGSSSFVISSFMRPGFDTETGEICRDDWNPGKEIGRLKKCFDYKQCYITHMPVEDSGAFWDATIYSPRDSKRSDQLRLPLKKNLDPKKYGSYSREQYAYFFVYKALKRKKETLVLAPVPVSVANRVSEDFEALAKYAQRLAEGDGMTFVEVVRRKVYKYQLIEVDQSRLYITGKKEVRNGVQIAFSQKETAVLERIVDFQEEAAMSKSAVKEISVASEELTDVFWTEVDSLQKYSPRLASALKIEDLAERFHEASGLDQGSILLSLSAIAAAKTNAIDLTAIGDSKSAGRMQLSLSKILSSSGITFIDQSVTGMFERREFVGL